MATNFIKNLIGGGAKSASEQQLANTGALSTPTSLDLHPNQPTAPAAPAAPSYTGASNVGAGQGNVGGAAGSGAAAPASGAAAAAPGGLQPQFNQALGQIQNAYNQLFGGYDAATGSAAANVKAGYDAQNANLQNQYAQTQQQLPWEYASRGANQSSWGENAFNSAVNNYNNGVSQLQHNETSDLSKIQQQADAAKAAGNKFLQNIPLLQSQFANELPYQQAAQLGDLLTQGQTLAGDVASNQPLSTFQNELNNNPTYQDQSAGVLQNQLKALAGSGAPTAVQNQIAQGIYGNPNNPYNSNYWQNYWQGLQNTPQQPQLQGV